MLSDAMSEVRYEYSAKIFHLSISHDVIRSRS